MPMELIKFEYRRLFKLSAVQLEQEPIDELFTNLRIWSLINKKKELEIKHGPS